MRKIKAVFWAAGRAFGPTLTILGSLMMIFGTWSPLLLGPDAIEAIYQEQVFALGLSFFVIGGASVVLRIEWKFRELDDFYGNEHKKALWRDGIPPIQSEYFRFLQQGDFGTVNRFWRAGSYNLQDDSLQTDLHVAAQNGHSAIVRGLIERGGDPKRPNKQGRTPLMLAASRGHVKVVEVLLDHDCALNATAADDGVSALYAAASNGHSEMISTLIRAGADVDQPDRDNISPLMAAIEQENWEIARRLIQAGADVSRVDRNGATLRDYIESQHGAPAEIVASIVNRGINFHIPRIVKTGSGHSYTGKVTLDWELADVLAERQKHSEASEGSW